MPKKNNKTGIKHLEKNHINWFPGHMNKAIKEIKNRIKQVSIVIEVRDARAPMTSGNKDNYYNNGEKPYLIVINKTNLADPESVKLWKDWFSEKNEPVLFINALDKTSIKIIVKRSKEIIQAHRLKSNATTAGKDKIKMMILGLPNTGKSTIINSLANRNASKAASTPGQTTVQLWVKVDKNIEILDTPGVMPPKVNKQIQGMWLSAIHAIPDHVVTPDYSACFIIEHLLKIKSQDLKEKYKFNNTGPSGGLTGGKQGEDEEFE